MTNTLTPYDRGVRAEPKVWSHVTRHALSGMSPIELELEEDKFGKVDFENDESSHVGTIWLENAGEGYVVHIAGMDDVRIEVHGG